MNDTEQYEECDFDDDDLAAADRAWDKLPPRRQAQRGTRGKAWAWVAGQPWAIDRASLGTILSIAERTNLSAADVAKQLGKDKLDNAPAPVVARNGVAVVNVRGPISRYAGMMSEISGATSIERLTADIRAAVEDPTVRSVVLSIDSPGGQANGVGELAGMIRSLSDRKPIVAYVGGYACSAAYWLAAACSEIVASETGVLGSVGCVLAVAKGDDEDEVEFVSSQSPNKHPDPETKAGRAEIQAHVDAMAQVFIDRVAEYREMTSEDVVSQFGKGGLKVGAAAVSAGMADRIGTFEGLLSELAALPTNPRGGRAANVLRMDRGAAALAQGPKTMKVKARSFLSRWLSAGKPEEIDVEAADAATGEPDIDTYLASLSHKPAPAPAPKTEEASVIDVKAIEAKAHRDALVMAFGHQAKTWAQSQVKAGRIAPANVEALAAVYVAHAVDDATSPLKVTTAAGEQTVSRLEMFTEGVEAKGKPHAAQTQELVPADAATVAAQLKAGGFKLFDNGASTPQDAERAQSLSRVEAMLKGSELGQQALAAAAK